MSSKPSRSTGSAAAYAVAFAINTAAAGSSRTERSQCRGGRMLGRSLDSASRGVSEAHGGRWTGTAALLLHSAGHDTGQVVLLQKHEQHHDGEHGEDRT